MFLVVYCFLIAVGTRVEIPFIIKFYTTFFLFKFVHRCRKLILYRNITPLYRGQGGGVGTGDAPPQGEGEGDINHIIIHIYVNMSIA